VGARLADFLRREGGLAAMAESDLHVCTDNPLGAAILALFEAAVHPGDRLAWEHLRMTPLGAVLDAEGLADPDKLTRHLLGGLHHEGFERTVEVWLRRLDSLLAPDDVFSRERGAQFAAAARRFDATGSRDVDEFIRFMEGHTERETESAAVVRVMTIHKAKGLGFDLVILPDLEGSRLDQRRDGLAVQKARDRSVEWVLDLPPKQFYDADEVLSAHVKAAETEACYEQLSLLYVAMTRARRAMYLIVKPPGASASNNFPRLLTATLGEKTAVVSVGGLKLAGSFSNGESLWHLGNKTASRNPPGPAAMECIELGNSWQAVRFFVRRPSETRAGRIPGAALFSLAGRKAADFGSALHALFASVEWWSPGDSGSWEEAQRRAGVDEAVLNEVLGCLNDQAVGALFARPQGIAEVWRERSFEGVLDGSWITGVFDRVVIERDVAGQTPARVLVVDFKSDRVDEPDRLAEAAERHAGQLDLYRRIAAVLTGVSAERIGCQLVFTGTRRVITMRSGT
jgi:hypothetical protein